MSTREPCDLEAVEARARIADGRLSPVDLLESCLERIAARNPEINAVVALDEENARRAAREAAIAARAGTPLGPLHGLPLGVKDLTETAGLRTTFGSRLFAEHVPEADEALVARLRAAGGIVTAKTNTPEFGAGAHTVNAVYGATRNPHDPARSAGGSSGGSAAALATGMLPLCTGSDTGGSLRTPAAFCGVVSIRPTPGVVPSERRAVGLTTFGVQGPMARTVADAALLLSAMAADDPADPLPGPEDPAALATPEEVDPAKLRVAWSPDLGFAPVEPAIRETFAERVDALAPAFAACRRADPDMTGASEAFWRVRALHFLAGQLGNYRAHPDLLGDNVRDNVEAALAMSPAELAEGAAAQTRIYRRFQDFFRDHDLLLLPTVPCPPFPIEEPYVRVIDGVEMQTYIQWVDLTAAITLTGHPVVALPSGLEPSGTPFGFQVVGPRRHRDRFTIGAAAAIERRLAELGLGRVEAGG